MTSFCYGVSMKEQLIRIFPKELREELKSINDGSLEEIRVRIGWPIELLFGDSSTWVGNYENRMDREKLDEMLNYITGYSLYAMEEELRQGYLPMEGGHRIGITGHTKYEMYRNGEWQKITNVTDIGGLNIRVAHEKKDCAKELVPQLRNGDSIYNTLFLAAPGVGKTTYLRDVVRLISDGTTNCAGKRVCVIDERSEIAACHLGVPQNYLGKRTDIMDGCLKTEGMLMALRSMSPQVIAVDELGGKEEYKAVKQIMYSGCKVIGTEHGDCIQDIKNRMFQRYVLLKREESGERSYSIYNEGLDQLC